MAGGQDGVRQAGHTGAAAMDDIIAVEVASLRYRWRCAERKSVYVDRKRRCIISPVRGRGEGGDGEVCL